MRQLRALLLTAGLALLIVAQQLAMADALPTTAHNAIPFKQEKQTTDALAYRSVGALVLVGVIAYGIVLGLKKFGARLPGPLYRGSRVRTLEVTRLSRQSTLYVIEYRGKELLLAEGAQGIQVLSSDTLTATPVQEGAVHA